MLSGVSSIKLHEVFFSCAMLSQKYDDDDAGSEANSDGSLPKYGENLQPMFYGQIFIT